MAGYWTRLQFLLKVLIDLDSVSVHKKGKKTNKQTTTHIYFMFPRLSGCKDLIHQIYQAVLK